jgi:hypothetical protein
LSDWVLPDEADEKGQLAYEGLLPSLCLCQPVVDQEIAILDYQEIGDETGREIVNEIDQEIVNEIDQEIVNEIDQEIVNEIDQEIVNEVVPRILAIEALVAWTDRRQSAYLKRILDREERPDMDSLETYMHQTKDFQRATPSFVLVWPCEAYSYSHLQVLQNCLCLKSRRWIDAFDRLLAMVAPQLPRGLTKLRIHQQENSFRFGFVTLPSVAPKLDFVDSTALAHLARQHLDSDLATSVAFAFAAAAVARARVATKVN